MGDYDSYIKLKKEKALEQGKRFWFEARLTDEEANLRPSLKQPIESYCLYCKFIPDGKCKLGHSVTDMSNQICDEWRYCF